MSDSHSNNQGGANEILSALSSRDYPALFADLSLVHLTRGRILYELGAPIEYAYFVLSGMVSLLAITEDGATTEISMVGNEGIAGVSVLLGVKEAPYRTQVQIPGRALRISSSILLAEFLRGGKLRSLSLRYTHSLIFQISQSAACNRFHSINQRLSRWLLVARDRVESDTLNLTQETLAHMLGSNRTNVTAAATDLKAAGLIEYRRGNIRIVDRMKLEKSACECYRAVQEQFRQARAA